MKTYLTVGMIVRAQYYEDAKYYDAKIDEVLSNGKYLVTFVEYGNQEEVPLSSIKIKDQNKSRSSATHDLDDEILRREREKATASGKGYIKRTSGHANMSMKIGSATVRKRSRSPERLDINHSHRSQDISSKRHSDHSMDLEKEKKARLLDRYGDASARR
jgi:hypothetical protein